MSAYLMVSVNSKTPNPFLVPVEGKFTEHDWWHQSTGWKNLLNNLRLILQPSY